MAIVDLGAVYKTYDTSSAATTASKTKVLDKDAFMKMFLAQLQNQDPMNPMDATQLASQMAQFTTVEQLSNLNTTVTKLLEQQTGATNAQMINLLGREAVVRGNTIYVADEKMAQGSFQLAETAFCRAQVYNAEGNLIKTITLGQQAAKQTIGLGWDGTDDQGNKVPDGTYTFKIVAERADGQAVEATTYAGGLITGFKTDAEGNPQLILNHETVVAYANVMEVRTPRDQE